VSATTLPNLPRQPLSPTEQLEALRRVQAQAEQRIKLGQQLFKAAEAHVTQQHVVIQQLKQQQQQLRQQVQEDVARSLQTYDQWIGRIDENFTHAMQALEEKLESLEVKWTQTEQRIAALTRRAEALLEQSRTLLQPPAPKPSRPPLTITLKQPLSISASNAPSKD